MTEILRTAGTVEQLLVAASIGKILLRDETDGVVELFLLWSGEPDDPTGRIVHSMYVSLCREALLGGKRVEVSHAQDSSVVTALALFG
jgi:hypothetical protein